MNCNIIVNKLMTICNLLKYNSNFPPVRPLDSINISKEDLVEIERIRDELNVHFDIFCESYGLGSMNVQNIKVAKVFTYSLNYMYDTLASLVNNNNAPSTHEYISFLTILYYSEFFLNVIENAINLLIRERVRRNEDGVIGWNAFNATLWHYFKRHWVDELRKNINICITFCKDIANVKYIINLHLDRIIKTKQFKINDLKEIEKFCSSSNRDYYIYGKILSQY